MTPSESSSETPKPPVSPETLRVAWMADPATMAHHLTKGRYQDPPHVMLMSQAIVEAVRSGGRLLIEMPPRHSKSETVSHWAPVWFLNAWPKKRVILASYEADFAATWGRMARNSIDEHQDELLVRLAEDSTAANRWNTPQGGGMYTAGAGGALTGRGADLAIVDDPHKGMEEAQSETIRERVWDWWTSTLLTRLEPNAAVIVIQTRWHEDDLAGRILAQKARGWKVLRLPALAEDGDALGRAPGKALWPERFDEEALAIKRAEVGERTWHALYQQTPLGERGLFFRKDWLTHRYDIVGDRRYLLPEKHMIDASSLRRFATVDLAISTKASAHYTVIFVCGITPDGLMLVLDVERARIAGPDIVPALKRMRDRWDLPSVWIEKVGYQTLLIEQARRERIPVRELIPDKDKLTRATPVQAALEGGRVLLPRTAPWLYDLEAELLSFPEGTFDDQVDALAYAVRVQQEHRGCSWPPEFASDEKRHRYPENYPPDDEDDEPRDPFEKFMRERQPNPFDRLMPPGGWGAFGGPSRR